MRNNKAQVWVETVIYTLIGLAIIGILLAAARPKIDSMKDKLVIEQTIESLNKLNSKIKEVQIAPGNKREITLKISKGTLTINSIDDEITWILESGYQYSEPNIEVSIGDLNITTTGDDPWTIKLSSTYEVDLQYQGNGGIKKIEFIGSPI